MTRWAGVLGAPVTPFDDAGALDLASLERNVEFFVTHGVDGVTVPLHTGESPSLSVAERKRVAEMTLGAVAGRVPVLVHVSMPGTGEVIELARHAEASGAAAVISVTPYHWRPSPAALRAHYTAVCGAVGIDVLAYNFPSRLGVSTSPALLEQLLDTCPNFVGVKDASYDMQHYAECVRRGCARRPDFAMLAGVEYLLPSLALGGTGCFSPSSAIAPRLVRRLYDACTAGAWDEARALQWQMSGLWHLLRETGYPASIKAAMAILGRPTGGVRLPLLDLDGTEVVRLRAGLESLGVIDEEPTGWA